MNKMAESPAIVAGEFVVQDLFREFTYQINRKVDLLLSGSPAQLDAKHIMKSLQHGEDAQFDQLLGALGCVAEHCLPSLLETLFEWYDQQIPMVNVKPDGKSSRSSVKSKSDTIQREQDVKKELKEMAISIVFCLVLIEVLQQLPVYPLPENQIQHILSLAFAHFRRAAMSNTESTNKERLVADLFAEVIGVMAKTKFQNVRSKFMLELDEVKKSEHNTRFILGLIMGMKFFRVKMYPVEDFEASFRFLRELADYSLEVKDREIKYGLAGLFVEILVPVAAAVKTEVNVPVLRDFVDALYPTSLELSKRKKNHLTMYPLVTCLLCVSQKQFFLNNWHIFLDNCLSNLKNRDQKVSRVALESLYRLLWAYTVRIKCESNTATQSRLQSIVKTLFPVGSRSIVPKDTPLSIYVKIIQFIAQERLDFAMKEIILDLLCINLSGSRNAKIMTMQPERMNIGLRAFLVITDSLQQKDGAPPMPTTVGVMPSGSTLRVKKTFLNKMLTEDEARTIGVLQYHKHVQKALDWILVTLDGQVGQRMMMTNPHINNRTTDITGGENKPKIDLFRTCIAAMPRLIPAGSMTQTELFELLSRLTIHIDEDLRSQAFTSLLSFTQDFPEHREDVIAAFVSFILKQVTDIHNVLLDTALKHLMQLISGWRNKSTLPYPTTSFTSRPRIGKAQDVHERRSAFAPLINHLEGFALVLLCSNRSVTRKLACLLLKEVKTLARTLSYNKTDDELCIDVLDRLCPAVAAEVVIDQEVLHNLTTVDCKTVLAVSEKCDVTALVECTSSWSQHNNVDLWTSVIASFMKPARLPTFCPSAVDFSWSDVNIRLTQLWQHMDPIQTSSNKKAAASIPSSTDANLSLWTNYLVFACRCAPTSIALMKKQSLSAIPAGTPDWFVTLSRDPERNTATPSALFQRLITLLRMENNFPLRDSAVIGLGSTSITAFPDLLNELMTVIHEACKSHRQDNMRRKRKRDNTRVMLSRVLERLARHKVLSESVSSTISLSPTSSADKSSNSTLTLSQVLLDYIKDTCSFLEAVDKVEFAPVSGTTQPSQQPVLSPFPGTLSSSATSLQAQSNTPNLMDELRIHFGSMIAFLIRHLPEHSQDSFLPAETRRVLFFLFGRWCGKYGDALDGLETLDGTTTNTSTLLHVTALKAECAVLCCGLVFDNVGLQQGTGYLYPWLEALLDYSNPRIHKFGREAVILLLRHNRGNPALLSWLIDKCYTGSTLVSTGCFCSIAAAFSYIDLSSDMIALLNLALFNVANSEVSSTAQHLLIMIQTRIMTSDQSEEAANEIDDGVGGVSSASDLSKEKSLRLCLNLPHDRMYFPPLYSLSQFDISKDLARLHPEFTIAMLSEIFSRFMLTTTTVWQQLMLQYMLPWLKNVELALHDDQEKVPELNNCQKMFDFPLHMLRSCGWGSSQATLFILSNLTYMTIRYYGILGNEIEKCWSTLCHTWPGNLDVLLLYTSALSSCGSCDSITFITRRLITFFARAKSKEVAQYLVKECQISDSPNFGIEVLDQPPFLKIKVDDIKSFGRVRPTQTTSPPRSIMMKKKRKSKSILSSSAPTSFLHINNKSPTHGKTDSSLLSQSPVIRNNHSLSKPPAQLAHGVPHHLSLQHLNTDKHDTETSPRRPTRPMSVHSKMSMSMFSLPNFSTDSPKVNNFRYSHHEAVSDTASNWSMLKDGKTRSTSEKIRSSMNRDALLEKSHNVNSNFQDNVFLEWRKKIEHGYPHALPQPPTPLYYLRLNEYFNEEQIQKSNGLLRSNIACVLLSEIVIEHGVIIDWKVYLPTLLLSLFLGMDVGYGEVPQRCQLLLAHIIIQLLSPKEQVIFASSIILSPTRVFFDDSTHSLTHLKKETTPTSACTTDSGIESTSSPHKINDANGLVGMSNEPQTSHVFDAQTLSAFIQKLFQRTHGQLWPSEDISPKCTMLKSTDQLTEFVSSVISVVGSLVPDYELSKKLAKQSLKFAVRTSNRHCASRALQVFRSLRVPLRLNSVSELSLSLTEFIADGNDVDSQSWAIEILLTLLQTCEISSAGLTIQEAKYDKPSIIEQKRATIQQRPPSSPIPVTPTNNVRGDAPPTSMPVKVRGKGRKGHAHRRSGSVSISKQVLEEAKSVTPEAPPTFEPCCTPTIQPGDERTTIHTSLSNNYLFTQSNKPRGSMHVNMMEEWKSGLAQIFWIAVGILESDFEHEYLIALRIIRKVLEKLKLNESDGRIRLERSFNQIQWHKFQGLQSLLLKGLTCNTTFEAAFCILFDLTMVTHLPIVSTYQDGSGFAINVVALLPRLVNQFGDPDLDCCECAQNIAQVCVDYFKDHNKLQSLAHVMSLYSNNTYNKSVQTWVNVVCKYVYETFPQALNPQLVFLSEMLDKGHSSFHLASLHIVLSLLSLSTVLNDKVEGKLHDLLHIVAKHLNGKNWKEALNILKLAVSRSSQLASPTSAFTVTQGDEKDLIELPGLTLSFKFDLSKTPLVGQQRPADGKEVSSPLGSGWRRPHLSQRRTRERLRSVLSVCSLARRTEDAIQQMHQEASDTEATSPGHMSPQHNDYSSPETEDSLSDEKSGMDEVQFHGVFRDFDFLNEIEENEGEGTDNFGMHWNTSTSSTVVSTEVAGLDEQPDECDLTPIVPSATEEEEDDSDTVSISSHASSIVSNPNLPVTERSSNECMTSEHEDNQQNARTSEQATTSAATVENNIYFAQSSPNTYIRAVSPSPPELALKNEERVFSTQKSVTEQVNLSDSESSYSDGKSTDDEMPSNESPSVLLESPSSPAKENQATPTSVPSIVVINSPKKKMEDQELRTNLTKEELCNTTLYNATLQQCDNRQRWKTYLSAVADDSDGVSISKFFAMFPSFFCTLCIDFSLLSKEGCSHLGSQLSSISNHFSVMVDNLPRELECPLCIATEETYLLISDQLKSYVADLQDQLEFYSSKQEDAYDSLQLIYTLHDTNRALGDESGDTFFQLEQKQLELCRLLYTLHFQILLIFQSFNRLVHVVATSLPQNNNTSDQLVSMHKAILAGEPRCKEAFKSTPVPDDFVDIEVDLKSMTHEEGLASLNATLQDSNYKLAQMQLCVLRKLWPAEPFGCHDDSCADFLTTLRFRKTIGARSDGAVYAIIGENEGSQVLCEKLMEVNMQIQHSLQLLEKPRTKMPENKSSANDNEPTHNATASSVKQSEDLTYKRTSF